MNRRMLGFGVAGAIIAISSVSVPAYAAGKGKAHGSTHVSQGGGGKGEHKKGFDFQGVAGVLSGLLGGGRR